ncbi:MAG: PQQ-binding-like beta-propeller repeat protein, partial [bacterium]
MSKAEFCSTAAFLEILLLLVVPSHAQLADSPWPMFHRDLRHTGHSGYRAYSQPYVKWAYQTLDTIYHSSPAIGPDGTIYVGSMDEILYALNPDGTLKWRYDAPARLKYSSPALSSDTAIYIGCDDGNLYAFNSDSTLRWTWPTGGAVRSSPA